MKKFKKLVLLVMIFSLFQGCNQKEFVTSMFQDIVAELPNSVEQISESMKQKIENAIEEALSNEMEDTSADAPYKIINNNFPEFTEEEYTTDTYEQYSDLDSLDRPGMAVACLGPETMPTEERGSIGQIKPAGWHTVKYDCITDGMYLYNRCHLIGYQLCGTNFLADEMDDTKAKNLITGTRYLNVEGMLPFENMVAEYIETSGNHVLYRVTPIYTGNNLIADGVQMEAYSVEDNGEGICFNVFCYNIQPGIEIDYATGESWEVE